MDNRIVNENGGKKLPAGNEASGRLLALDAARGLAVTGMFIQHFALNQWNNFVSGNTMILFMVCSGISYTLMTQRMAERGTAKCAFHTRILARSVLLDFVGYVLIMLNGPFAVVLTAYAMLFLMAVPLARCRKRVLFLISGVSFFLCPPLMMLGMSLFAGSAVLNDIAGGPLSALAWAPVFIAGMAIGHLRLDKTYNAVKFILTGIAILIPFKLFETFVLPGILQSFSAWLAQLPGIVNPQVNEYAMWPLNTMPALWHMLFLPAPQGGSTFELADGLAGSLILLGALILIEKKMPALLKPFSVAGQVALTLYVVQIVIGWGISLVGIGLVNIGSVPFGGVLTAACALGLGYLCKKIKNGPLEAMLRWFEKQFV